MTGISLAISLCKGCLSQHKDRGVCQKRSPLACKVPEVATESGRGCRGAEGLAIGYRVSQVCSIGDADLELAHLSHLHLPLKCRATLPTFMAHVASRKSLLSPLCSVNLWGGVPLTGCEVELCDRSIETGLLVMFVKALDTAEQPAAVTVSCGCLWLFPTGSW